MNVSMWAKALQTIPHVTKDEWARLDVVSRFLIASRAGVLFAHATNNLLNDVTDYKKGVDQDNYYRAQYGPQTLTHGLFTTREILTYAAVSGVLALAFGAYLVFTGGATAWVLVGLGAFFVLFYTWPLIVK